MSKYLTLFLLLSACGAIPDGIIHNGIDNVKDVASAGLIIDPLLIPDFNLFMQRCSRSKYMAICEQNAKKIKSMKVVDIANTSKPAVGVCYSNQLGRRIEIARIKALEGGVSLRAVTFHEFAHCILNLGHNDSKRHIMNTYDGPIKEGEWESLVDDLFE